MIPHVPLGGITGGGWRVVYNDEPKTMIAADQESSGKGDFTASIGLIVKADGTIEDVIRYACEPKWPWSLYEDRGGQRSSVLDLDESQNAQSSIRSPTPRRSTLLFLIPGGSKHINSLTTRVSALLISNASRGTTDYLADILKSLVR